MDAENVLCALFLSGLVVNDTAEFLKRLLYLLSLCLHVCTCTFEAALWSTDSLVINHKRHLQASTLTPTPSSAGFRWVPFPITKQDIKAPCNVHGQRSSHCWEQTRPLRTPLSVLSSLPLFTSVLEVSREEKIDYQGNNDQLGLLVLCPFSCPFHHSFPCISFVYLSGSCQWVFLCLARNPKQAGQSSQSMTGGKKKEKENLNEAEDKYTKTN